MICLAFNMPKLFQKSVRHRLFILMLLLIKCFQTFLIKFCFIILIFFIHPSQYFIIGYTRFFLAWVEWVWVRCKNSEVINLRGTIRITDKLSDDTHIFPSLIILEVVTREVEKLGGEDRTNSNLMLAVGDSRSKRVPRRTSLAHACLIYGSAKKHVLPHSLYQIRILPSYGFHPWAPPEKKKKNKKTKC